MRNRLWYELAQAKFNDRYVCLLIGQQRRVINLFNIIIASFSTAGIMGWKLWEQLPLFSCVIISVISLIKLLQPHIIPSDKQIEKLDRIADFYFNFYLQLESLWFDFDNGRICSVELQEKFHSLKQSEREINKIVNEVHKRLNRKAFKKAKFEADIFFEKAYNVKI